MNILEQAFHLAIGYLVPLVEACGALVVVMGVARAIWRYVKSYWQHDPLHVASLRLQLGQSMVMGIEFQVAADILRTALRPTVNDMLLLAALIGVRTVLNYLLERELTVLSAASPPSGDGRQRPDVET
jgi:uncharacterized membrane protein